MMKNLSFVLSLTLVIAFCQSANSAPDGKICGLMGGVPIKGASPAGLASVKEYNAPGSQFHVAPVQNAPVTTGSAVKTTSASIKEYLDEVDKPWDGKFSEVLWNHKSKEGWVIRASYFKAFIKEYGLFGMTRAEVIDFLGAPQMNEGKNIIGYDLVTWWCGNAYRGVEICFSESGEVSKYRYVDISSKEKWIMAPVSKGTAAAKNSSTKQVMLDPNCSK